LGEKPFCCGGTHLTLADISVCCALAWLDFRFPEMDWRAEHPNLAALLAKLAARPSFLNTVPHWWQHAVKEKATRKWPFLGIKAAKHPETN
jgi:glutathione S-transferase